MNTMEQKLQTNIRRLIAAMKKMTSVQFDVVMLVILAVVSAGIVLVVNFIGLAWW